MKELNLNEIKKIQLEVLRKVHLFCEENDIKYFLAYGSLLGAVRHGGYIPWDDDIDIAMTRPNYEKFIKLFDIDNCYLGTIELDKDWTLPYGKVCDKSSLVIESTGDKWGINIDVFPIDGVPSDDKLLSRHYSKIQKLRFLINRKRYIARGPWIIKDKGFFYLIKQFIAKLICMCVPSVSFLCLKLITIFRRYNYNISEKCADLNWGGKERVMIKEKIEELELIKFEDAYFWGLKDSDYYLSMIFGDYMQLPPEDKRVTHHSYTAYLLD